MNFKKSILQKSLNVLMSLAIIISQTVFSFDEPLNVFGLDNNVYISSSNGNTSFSGSAVYVDPNIVVDLHGQANVTGARVAIQSGFVAGDTLYHPNASYNSSTGILTFSGTYDQNTIQNLLRAVTFTASSASNTDLGTRTIGFTLGSGLYNEQNGHFYRILSAGGYAWTGARDIAASDSNKLFGLRGYLVTITSAQENTFIMEKVQSSSWIGASDAGSEYYWKWQTGPEAGTHFFTQYTDRAHGYAVNGYYHNFASGEPNGTGNSESYGEIIYSASYGSSGQWNDLSNTNYRSSIIIEYGGMPGDPQSIISSTKNVEIASASLVFNSNNASSGTTPSTQTKRINNSFTIPTNNLLNDGAGVIAWTTNADGSGTRYTTGNSITLSSNLTLYAQYGKYISSSSGKTEYTNTPVVVDPNLTVDYKYETSIQGASVKISSGFVAGDVLSHPSGTYYSDTGELRFSGTYTQAEMQTLLRAVTFIPSTSSGTNINDRSITFQLSNYNSDNGHYYALHPDLVNSVTYYNLNNLAGKTLFGRSAYLLNINSVTENNYLFALSSNIKWLGARKIDGIWKWISGPEAGVIIPTSNGNSVYSNWGKDEPSKSEEFVALRDVNNTWIDINRLGDSGDRLYQSGYEYGGLANEPTVVTSATKIVDIVTYVLSYDANGATSGSVPSSNSVLNGASFSLSSNTGSLNKLGYDFGGWNTLTDGTGTNFSVGSSYSITSNTTLYAKWNPISVTNTIVIGQSQSASTINSANLSFSTLNSSYTNLKYAIVKHGDPSPTIEEIKNGQYSNGSSFIKSASVTTSGTSSSVSVTSLPDHFLLDVYAIQLDSVGNVRTLSQAPKTIFASSIRAAYSFNNTLIDVTGQQRALVPTNYTTNTANLGYTTSNNSTVYNFDGTQVFTLPNDIIARNDLVNNANNGLFTVSMSFKTSSTTGFGLLGYNSGQNPYNTSQVMNDYIPILSVSPTGYLYAILWQGSSDFKVVSNYPVNDGQWHNVVLTASNNGTNQTLNVYVDGVSLGTATGNLNHFSMNVVTLGTNVASSRFDGNGFNYFSTTYRDGYWFKPFVGQMDNVIVYGQGLTAAQVQTTSPDIALEYELNGGSFTNAPQYLYSKTASSNYTLPTPTKSGYTFLGWYANSSFTGSAVTEVVAGTTTNQKYYAKWSRYITFAIPTFTSTYRYVTDLLVYSGTAGASTLLESQGRLRINPATAYQTGGVFFGQKLTLPENKAFSSHFSFKVTDGSNSADGFVYILSSNQASTASTGGGLGYATMANSVAIIFDTYYNDGNPTPNSISLAVNGVLTPLAYYQDISDLDFLGAIRYVWVDYDGTNLRVYYNKTNNVFSSATKVIDYAINLNTYLTTDDIYVGFTGSTGGSTQDNSIYSWYFDSRYDTIKPENASTTPLISDFTTIEISNPGEIAGSATVTVTLTTPDGSPKVNESVSLSVSGVGSTQTQTTNSSGVASFTVTNPNTFSTSTTKVATVSTSDTSATQNLIFKPYQSLSFNVNGGSSVSTLTTGYGQTWTQPTNPTKTGYVFEGWYTNSNLTTAFNWTTPASTNLTLYAKWSLEPIEYISGSESSVAYTNTALAIDSAIIVDLKGDDRGFKQAKVTITAGLNTGDVLSYTDSSNSFTTDPVASYDSTKGTLTINGSYTSTQWQAILRDVKFSTSSTSTTTRSIQFKMVQTMPSLVISGKTHYYEFINDTTDITWTSARTTSETKSIYGLNGYLATITSATENLKALYSDIDSVDNKNRNHAWIGASDLDSNGVWKWMSGPESGQQFWAGFFDAKINIDSTTNFWNGKYSNWHVSAQPKNTAGADYVIMSIASSLEGLWGNFVNDGSTYAFGYIVEYGGYDADIAHITTSTQDITFSSSSLSFDANGSTAGTVPTGFSQRLNTIISIPTNSGNLSKTGYTFAGWNTQADGQGTNYALGANFTLSTSAQTLYANWTINSYDVTFNSNNGSSIATQSIDYNLKASEPSGPTRSGYTFAGWYTDNTTFANAFDFENTAITQAVTLYAKWTLDTYSITYDLDSGTNALSNPSSYTTTTSTLTLADPSKDHYSFEGWFLESSFDTEVTQIALGSTGNKSFYAKFSPVSYSISYNLDGGSAVTVPSYTIESSTITLPTPTKVGYTFSHWIDLNDNDAIVTNIPTGSSGNQSFKAIFNINSYAVSFNTNGGSAVTSQSINYNTYAKAPSNPTKTGYTFEAWYHDVNLTQAFDFNADTITSAKTLYASWTINSYTLSFDTNGGSMIASQSKNYQQTFTQPTSPTRSGYQFEGWYTDDNTFLNKYDFSSLVTENKTIYAKWLIEVSYNMNYPDIATPSLSLVKADGTYSTLKSVGNVRPGYSLLGWYTSATGGDLITTSSTVTNNAPHTLYAHWGLIVSLNKQDGSSVVNYGNVKYGSTYAGYGSSDLSLPTPTRTGYAFEGWFSASTGGTQISSSTTVSLKDHHTLYAHWSAKTPTITLDLTNGGTIGSNPSSFTGSYDQAYGSSLVEPVRTEEGKYFLGWYTQATGGTLITNTDLVNIESNHTLYAQWGTYASFVVTYNGNGNTAGSAPSAQSQFTDANTTVSSAGTLVKTGYSFTGWNTQANGQGTDISVGTIFDTDEERVNTTLYAQWSPNQYTVTLDKNDGTSTSQNISVIYDSTYSKLSNPFSRTGFTFSKWLDANNQEITSNTSVNTASAHTLFAQWDPITYIATYFSQGGSFITRPNWFEPIETNQYGEDVSTSGTAIYSRYYGGVPTVSKTGYVFKEWNSAADESGTEVTGTSIVNTASDHSYYAIWIPATNTAYTVEYYQQNLGGTGYRLVDSQVFTGTTDSSITITPNSFTGFDRETTNLSLTILPDGSSTKAIYYARQNRTLTFDSNGGSQISDQVLQYQQAALEPSDPTRTGYTFAGWFKDDGTFANAYDFSDAVLNNTSLYAKWTSNPYTITYNLNGGSATTVNTYTIETPTITLPTPIKTGYTFVSWHSTSNFSDQAVTQISLGSYGNKTFYAKYTPITYSISYSLNGGTATTQNSYTIESSDIDLPTPVRSGYSFVGWYDNANFTGSSIPSIPEGSYGNKAFYAKWTTNAYTLTYNLNGGSASTVSSYTIETPTLPLPTPIKTGYDFVRWENGVGNTVTSIPQGSIGNQSFTAIYTPVIYSITYNLNGGSASTVSTYTIESNRIDLPSPTKVGYTFNRWIDHSNNTVSNIPSGSIGNRDYTAIFDINSYSVSFNTNGGSSINPASVVYNTYLTQPQDPLKDGYTFEAWYEDASFNQAFDFNQSRITHAKTLYAKYNVNTYTLEYELDGGLATNPSTYTIISSNIVLNRPTKTGFSFVGWYDTPNFTGNAITQISTGTFGNKTLYAKFENALFSLNYDANGGFFVPETDVIFGETIPTLPIPRRDGYRFEGWFSDVALSNRFTTTIMPSRDLNLYAKWSLIQYGLTYDTQGGVHSNPSTYSILNGFNLSPASRVGYVFEGWTLFGNSITEVQRGSTGDLVFVAQYRLAERMGSFANFSLTELTSESASFSFALGDEGNPRYTSFRYTLNHPNLGTVQSGSINGSSFTLSGLEAYVNYSITLMATNGLSRIETSLNFTPRLKDSDNDGIPDVRDAYPNDPKKSYNTENLNPELTPVRALVADNNTSSEVSIRIDPKDLMGTSASDTILLVMGSTQFVIPVAILDSMIAKSLNEETYLSLKVEPQLLNTDIPEDLLDPENSTIVKAFDYLLMQVDQDGNETQIHELGGKIKIGVDLNTIVGEYDPENLEVYYYDPEDESLQVMSASYDPINHSIVFMTDHFSYYVLGVKKENDPTKTTLQVIFLAISLIIAFVYWFKKNFNIVKK